MNFSSDIYTLPTTLPLTTIVEKLSENTLLRKTLVKEKTQKLFIGQVTDDGFLLLGSSRTGALCTLKGSFEHGEEATVVYIETKLTRAFVILFWCWVVFIIGASIFGYMSTPHADFSLGSMIILLFLMIAARLLLHFGYQQSRNKTVDEIKNLLT